MPPSHVINFVIGGMLGDFIHTLYAVKNICSKENAKANIYITDNPQYGGDIFRFGVQRAYKDLYSLVTSQSYVNSFQLMPDEFTEPFINGNDWRSFLIKYYAECSCNISWSELMSKTYDFSIIPNQTWVEPVTLDKSCENKIAIHRSSIRHNPEFPWKKIIDKITDPLVFVSFSEKEWNDFPFKAPNIELKVVSTIEDMANVLSGCKYFIGNQSSPLALASALNVPRIAELYSNCAVFYMNEKIYYPDKLSWFESPENNFFSPYSLINF